MRQIEPTPGATFLERIQADFLSSGEVQLWRSVLFLLLAAALGLYVRFLYDRVARTAADSDSVSRIFPLLTVVTTCIIAVIKSSLAVSLGLVGALSIVRFRAAIKEPEELVFLFLCICIGLCVGAEVPSLAVGAALVASLLVVAARFTGRGSPRHNVLLTIAGDSQYFASSEEGVHPILQGLSRRHYIQRYDVEEDEAEVRVLLGQVRPDEASAIVRELSDRLPGCRLSYVNTDGLR